MNQTGGIVSQLEFLLKQGQELLVTCEYSSEVDPQLNLRWRINCKAFMESKFGKNSEHFERIVGQGEYFSKDNVCKALGIMESALDSVRLGLLSKTEKLVAAEIFTNFVEMSEHLLLQGYKHAAISVAGAALEDGLRRCCQRSGVTLKDRDDISALAHKLLDKKAIDRLQMKQVAYWKNMRDLADHGHFDKVAEIADSEVGGMIRGLPAFLDGLP